MFGFFSIVLFFSIVFVFYNNLGPLTPKFEPCIADIWPTINRKPFRFSLMTRHKRQNYNRWTPQGQSLTSRASSVPRTGGNREMRQHRVLWLRSVWGCRWWHLYPGVSFPGSVPVQCSADGTPHLGRLCVPSLGPGCRVVNGPLLHGPHSWLHGIYVPHTQRHIQRGNAVSGFWLSFVSVGGGVGLCVWGCVGGLSNNCSVRQEIKRDTFKMLAVNSIGDFFFFKSTGWRFLTRLKQIIWTAGSWSMFDIIEKKKDQTSN